MTREGTNLLIQDICARLKSGLICSIYREDDEGCGWRDSKCKGYFQNNDSYEFYFEDVIAVDNIERLKPYLRPMSSMTEDEREEYRKLGGVMSYNSEHNTWTMCAFTPEAYDWLNKKQFDYRGLIPIGLALEATEEMYKKD